MGEVQNMPARTTTDAFEPEIEYQTAEGDRYTMRLDFAVARKIRKEIGIDLLAGRFAWTDLKLEKWPQMLHLLLNSHHEDLSIGDCEKILHPRNAVILTRTWARLWNIFNASETDAADRALMALVQVQEVDAAPADVQEAAVKVMRWLRKLQGHDDADLDDAERVESPSPDAPQEPTG